MLPRENRLTKRSDFENVRQNGKFVSNPIFSISFARREDKNLPSRFGFIVSKKISTKANARNRVKRILREELRENINSVKRGYDFVFIVKHGILTASHDTITAQIISFVKKF